MGGKTSQTTQAVSIPPEVLARYNAVNARAEQVAQRPFQQYTGQFVAPLTGTQQAGIAGTSAGANIAQPFYGAGAGMTLAGAQNVGPLTQGQIAYYENPYLESVARPTYQALRQQQQEEMMGQTANAIRSGAFGGDRAGLVAANLARQQQLGTAQAMAPIYAQGYGQAVQTAAGQQGVIAQDLARQMAAGQQIAGLGTGAQQAALQGAQAQLAAGTAEQQTQQADLTARYNQFLQEQGYPFQVAQFLANIAMGTGALSGSTTTTTQPSSFFSDRRLKDNVEEIGKLKDGQKLYRYTMADGRTHIGLMADEVEKHHPDAVGLAGGYKTVDYRAATDDAARHKKAYGGGLAPSSEGGAVMPDMAGMGFARGGGIEDIRRMLTMHREMYPYGHIGLYGNPDQRKGPYSTTMREINIPSRPLAPTTVTIRPLNYAADVPYGVAQYASGGVAGYAQGGLPYSEASDEYVPEDISKPMTPASMKPAGAATGSTQDPTVADLMRMGRMAASLYSGMPFASGGVVPRMADGGYMDLDRVLAMQQQMYGSMGRPAGLNIPMSQTRDYEKSMAAMRPGAIPAAPKSGMQEAMETYGQAEKAAGMASNAYGAGKTALLGTTRQVPASGNAPAKTVTVPGLIGAGGEYKPEAGLFADPSGMRTVLGFSSGGIAGRLHYQDAGVVPSEDNSSMTPEQRAAIIDRNIRADAARRQSESQAQSAASRDIQQFPFRSDIVASDIRHSQSIPTNIGDPVTVRSPRSPAPEGSDYGYSPPIEQSASAPSEPVAGVAPPLPSPTAPAVSPVSSPAAAPALNQSRYVSMNMPGMGRYEELISNQESRGNPRAQSSTSSASGLFQFLSGSWNDVRRANPDLNLPATVMEATPEQQSQAFRRFTESNAGTLRQLGQEANYPNLALAHYFGAGGANALLNIDPNTRFDQLSDEFVRSRLGTRGQGPQSVAQLLATNPNLRGMTVGQLINSYRDRYGNIDQPQEGERPPVRNENLVSRPANGAPGGVTGGAAPVEDISYNQAAGLGEALRPIDQETIQNMRQRVLASSGSQQPVSGGEGEGGIMQAVANERFLVPLLAGLAGMASSPSRYFGSALLQGLGAGAKAYEGLATAIPARQKTQAEAYMQESALRDRLYNEFENYKALTGDYNLPIEEFAKRIGIPYRIAIPTPSTVPAAGAPAASGQRPQMDLTIQGYRSATVTYPDGSTVRASNDPGYLRDFIARNSSITAPAVVGAVNDAKSRLSQIESTGRTTDVNGNEIFIPGRQQTLTQEQQRQRQTEEASKFTEAGNNFLVTYQPQMQRLRDLDKIYKEYIGGGFAAAPKAELAALARAVGVNLPENWQNNDTAYQTAMKLITQQMIANVADMSGNAPRAELQAAARAVADPGMSPEARRNIIVQMKAALEYQNRIYSNYNPASAEPISSYLRRIGSENLWQKSVEDADKSTPEYGRARGAASPSGLTPQQAREELERRRRQGAGGG